MANINCLPGDDKEYIEKFRQNRKFKCCVFRVHNFEADCSQ